MYLISPFSLAVPPNGLVIYCGTIVTEEGKEKKVNIDFEPFKPINTSLYLCDNKFHTEALTALLADDNKFGFIVMDGNGALFGTLQGNTREVSFLLMYILIWIGQDATSWFPQLDVRCASFVMGGIDYSNYPSSNADRLINK